MLSRVVIVLVAVGVLLAACTGGGAGSTPSAEPSASSAPSGSAATRIEVTLTDALKIEPATMSVPAVVPVTFVVTNSGATEHELYVGDEAAQADHEQEMQAGGMMHDDPNGISLAAGETKELTHTFDEAGETLAGCHVAGHYPGGMKATITVTG
jgi:uncharacterized cupredoxin-like copper-binding protein